MPDDPATRRYLVLIEAQNPTPAYIDALKRRVESSLERASVGKTELIYFSKRGDGFAFGIRTTRRAAEIRSMLAGDRTGAARGGLGTTVVHDSDKVLVLELASDHDSIRYQNKIEPWLSRG